MKLGFAAGLVVAAAGARYAFASLDWAAFARAARALDARWLALAVAFDIASYIAQGLRWRLLLKRATLFQTTRAIYAGLFVNEFVPLRPGEALRAWLAARDLNTSLASVVPTLVAERIMDGLCLLLALIAAAATAPLPDPVRRAVWLAGASLLILAAAAFLLRRSSLPAVSQVLQGLSNPVALAVSASFLLCQGLAFWAVMRASHLPLSALAAFAVMLSVRLATLLPGAPANLGSHQLATMLALSLYGVARPQAAAFAFIVFTVLTLPLLVLGAAAFITAGARLRPAPTRSSRTPARAPRGLSAGTPPPLQTAAASAAPADPL